MTSNDVADGCASVGCVLAPYLATGGCSLTPSQSLW